MVLLTSALTPLGVSKLPAVGDSIRVRTNRIATQKAAAALFRIPCSACEKKVMPAPACADMFEQVLVLSRGWTSASRQSELAPLQLLITRGRISVHQWSRLGNHSCYCRSIPISSGAQSPLKTLRTDPADPVSNLAVPKYHSERLPPVLNTTIGRTVPLLYLSRTFRSCAHR